MAVVLPVNSTWQLLAFRGTQEDGKALLLLLLLLLLFCCHSSRCIGHMFLGENIIVTCACMLFGKCSLYCSC
jgi:hypothetical protein